MQLGTRSMIKYLYLSKYFLISFLSHLILIVLFLSGTEVVERVKIQKFYERKSFIEITFLTKSPEMQGSVFSDRNKPHQIEAGPLENPAKDYDTKLSLSNSKQKLEVLNRSIEPNPKNISNDNVKSAKKGPFLSISEPPLKEKIEKSAPAVTAAPEIPTVGPVRYKKISTPTPKPKMRADLHAKISEPRVRFKPSNSSTLKNPLTNNERSKNTPTAEKIATAILEFNKKFLPKFESSKDAQYSAEKMPKQSEKNKVFLRSYPNVEIKQTKRHCKLALRKKKNNDLNVREIQNQIQANKITIANILNNNSPLKSNEISISSLLGSNFNIPWQDPKRATNTIGSLLTKSNLQGQVRDLFCEP